MTSLILQTAARFLLPLLLLFSIFLLYRGHNEPGGGFSGGLVASVAFILYATAYDTAEARRAMRLSPWTIFTAGLLTATSAGLAGMAAGRPFLTGAWIDVPLGGMGTISLGTPLLFDAGVYLTVIGSVMMIYLSLREK